jgi:hypothetical protein
MRIAGRFPEERRDKDFAKSGASEPPCAPFRLARMSWRFVCRSSSCTTLDSAAPGRSISSSEPSR